MRKTIFWLIGIIAFIVVLTRYSDLIALLDTIQQGAVIPLVLAVVFQVGRYLFQSATVASSFTAVEEKADWRHMVPLVLSGIFINTLAPSGGTAGAVLLVDDGIKRDISPGKSTTAALLGQMANYTGFIVIMFIGFTILGITGKLDPGTFVCGMVMVMAVSAFAGAMFMCYNNEELLTRWCLRLQGWIERQCARFHRRAPKPWAERIVGQVAEASTAIAHNPRGLLPVLAFAILGSALEMLCFIFVGLAFGVTEINVLVGGYVVTNIFTVVSPSPNGVGVAEVAATLILTAYGTSVSTATAVALVFRGFVFWIPFAIGALLLRRTGFFAEKKDATQEDKAKSTGYLAGLFVCVFGLANVFFAILPSVPKDIELLSEWFNVGSAFSPTVAVALGLTLVLMTRGMVRRSRTTWAWTMALLVLLAAFQLMSHGRSYVIVAVLALAVWLYVKRGDFDKLHVVTAGRRHVVVPLVLAALMVLAYTVAGYALLGTDYFEMTGGVIGVLWATVSTFVPTIGGPAAKAAYGTWFQGSIITVAGVAAIWAAIAIMAPVVRTHYYELTGRIPRVDAPADSDDPGDGARTTDDRGEGDRTFDDPER